MTKHKFGNRFTDDDFLAAMPEDTLITSMGISHRVGCSHETARIRLEQLEEKGRIKKVEIIGGRDAVWQRVKITREELMKIQPPAEVIIKLKKLEEDLCLDHETLKNALADIFLLPELERFADIDYRYRQAAEILLIRIEFEYSKKINYSSCPLNKECSLANVCVKPFYCMHKQGKKFGCCRACLGKTCIFDTQEAFDNISDECKNKIKRVENIIYRLTEKEEDYQIGEEEAEETI